MLITICSTHTAITAPGLQSKVRHPIPDT